MRPLILDGDSLHKIDMLLNFAAENTLSNDHLMKIANGAPPPGDDPRHVVHIPVGFRVVYSEEMHKQDKYRHLSVSVSGERYPAPDSILEILRSFKFEGVPDLSVPADTAFKDIPRAVVYLEKQVRAVSVIQALS